MGMGLLQPGFVGWAPLLHMTTLTTGSRPEGSRSGGFLRKQPDPPHQLRGMGELTAWSACNLMCENASRLHLKSSFYWALACMACRTAERNTVLQSLSFRPFLTHTHTHTYTHRFNGHFPRWTWVSRLPPLILLLHLFLYCASFWDRPKLSMSFLTQSHQVFFGPSVRLSICPVTSWYWSLKSPGATRHLATVHSLQRLHKSATIYLTLCGLLLDIFAKPLKSHLII